MKKIGIFLLVLLLCVFSTGCSEMIKLVNGTAGEENPLSGKNTDERIIMCLEQTYPEHTFNTVKSFDESTDCGIYSDETGVEFNVSNIIYNNTYHFGCDDAYLKSLLESQNYINKVAEITKKYNLTFMNDDSLVRINTNNSDNISDISLAIYEIFNCVNVPEVNWPEEQGFSTGVINYYTIPDWGVLLCRCETGQNAANEVFTFSEVNLTKKEIEQRLETCYERIQN